MPAAAPQRWTYTQPSPLGDVHSSVELSADGLRLQSDATMGPGTQSLRWQDIAEAATALMELPYNQGGGPDMARWIPGQLEWLLLARSGSNARAVMWPLPPSEMRDAIVAGVRERVGARWVGERMALAVARKRFDISGGDNSTLKVVGLVIAVLVVLFLLLVLFVYASALLWFPVGVIFGGWLIRRGLNGLSDARRITGVPSTTPIASAPLGVIELEGHAVTGRETIAAVSGQPSAWWDVAVESWSDNEDDGGWKPMMSRHGGDADVLWLDTAAGRVPVWLRDAELLLREQVWENGKDALPAGGVALLAGTAFAWERGGRVRVRETRVALDEPVVVVGTLDEARHLPVAGDEGVVARVMRSLRTGEWRASVLAQLPRLVRAPVGIAFATIDLILSVGRGGERARRPQDGPPPQFDPSTRLIWRGRAGRALIVSNRRADDATAQWRQRSLLRLAVGVVVVGLCIAELF